MNIFYLDENPAIAATYHCDKHVVKMILESAQLLCTALNVTSGKQITPYKTTHVNHPCAIWVRESLSNWNYVFQLMLELEKEWQLRYKHVKRHKSVSTLLESSDNCFHFVDMAKLLLADKPFTSPALAMPDHCKISSDPTECYRYYYRTEKKDLLNYTGREMPFWLEN